MKKKLQLLLIVCIVVISFIPQFSVYAADKQKDDDYENYSEAYKWYLELPDEKKANFTAIPRKYDIPIDTIYENTKDGRKEIKISNVFDELAKTESVDDKDESLPEKFNLRDIINIPAKNQGLYGNCWNFASMRSLETNLVMHNYGEFDFSELHVDYLTSSEFGGERELHDGGWFSTAEEYFLSHQGPVLETECPYNKAYTADDYEYLLSIQPSADVKKTINFPTLYKRFYEYSDEELKLFRDTVKEHIMKNGSVYAGFYQDYTWEVGKDYYCTSNYDNIWGGHAISIIGWDDKYSKDNFKDWNGNKPAHDGAYIILDQVDGYDEISYISYDDEWIESEINGVVSAIPEIHNVKFEDSNLYNGIKEKCDSNKLQFNDNEKIISGYKKNIYEAIKTDKLDLSNKNITDLSGIDYFITNISELNLSNNNISNIDYIIQLSNRQKTDFKIEKIDLSHNNIKDISNKFNKHYDEINLSYNDIEDASNLCNLVQSGTINLSGNPLKNGLKDLFSSWSKDVYLDDCGLESKDFDTINYDYYDGKISLRNNNITDVSFLSKVTDEGQIDLSGNVNLELNTRALCCKALTLKKCNISNLEPLKNFGLPTSILDISDNPISDISVFTKGMIGGIYSVDLSNTNVSDVSALAYITKIDLSGNNNLTGLNNLIVTRELTLRNCGLSSIAGIGSGNNLQYLDASNNELEDISDIYDYKQLKSLNLSSNNVSNISVLKDLNRLEFLDLSNNKVVDISPLSNKNNLSKLDLSNNLIEDVSIYKDSTLYIDGNETYINLSGNKIQDLEDVKQFWEYYDTFTEEKKEKQKINNQHYEFVTDLIVGEENKIDLPSLFGEEHKTKTIEAQNCEIDYEKNLILITPSELGKGTSNIRIIGGLYDDTTYTINYNAIDEIYLPIVNIEGDISTLTTDQDEERFILTYLDDKKNMNFTKNVTLKLQGETNLAYPKHSFDIEVYSDESFGQKEKIDMGKGWGYSNKYCLRSNITDPTQARNIVTSRLVADVQERYGLFTDEKIPNNGVIDGYPVQVNVNGEFYGVYTWNIPKNAWIWNINEEDKKNIVVQGKANNSEYTLFKKEIEDNVSMLDANWKIVEGSDSEENIKAKLNRLIKFISESSDEEFKAHIDEYLNKDALLNYLVFVYIAEGWDNIANYMTLVTYDGNVWYPTLYNLDSTWGRGAQNYNWVPEETYTGDWGKQENVLIDKFLRSFSNQLARRYFEIRENELSKENIVNSFDNYFKRIPNELYEMDKEKWKNTNGYGKRATIEQLYGFINVRVPYIDEIMNKKISYSLGDVNADGKINVIDCTAILKHIKGTKLLTEEEQLRADVNKDNKVNVIDCTAILKHIKGTKLIEE